MNTIEVLEGLMLVSSSLSWYLSIAKMLQAKVAAGKSLHCVLVICLGYGVGIASKLLAWHQTGQMNRLMWLYSWNLLVAAFDAALIIRLSRSPLLRRQLSRSGINRIRSFNRGKIVSEAETDKRLFTGDAVAEQTGLRLIGDQRLVSCRRALCIPSHGALSPLPARAQRALSHRADAPRHLARTLLRRPTRRFRSSPCRTRVPPLSRMWRSRAWFFPRSMRRVRSRFSHRLRVHSCKGRGVCPACNTRRTVETAAHLADDVFPRLPIRQWVL